MNMTCELKFEIEENLALDQNEAEICIGTAKNEENYLEDSINDYCFFTKHCMLEAYIEKYKRFLTT